MKGRGIRKIVAITKFSKATPQELYDKYLSGNSRDDLAKEYETTSTAIQSKIGKIQRQNVDKITCLQDMRDAQNISEDLHKIYGQRANQIVLEYFDKEYDLYDLYVNKLTMAWDILKLINIVGFEEGPLKRYYYKHHYVLSEEDYKRYITKRTAITKERIYGDKYYSNHEKRHKTTLERYGVENIGSNKESHKKQRQVMKDTYGVEYAVQSDVFKNKISKTMRERYGADWYGASEAGRKVLSTRLQTTLRWHKTDLVKTLSEAQRLLRDTDALVQFIKKNIDPDELTLNMLVEKTGIHYRCFVVSKSYLESRNIVTYNHKYEKSQNEMTDYISSLYNGNDLISKARPEFMEGQELDVYIPSRNLAFEFNGEYWHSDYVQTNTLYHQHKTELARAAGVMLFHIWEYDWKDPVRGNIIKSQIKHALGLSERIYARKTVIVEVSQKDVIAFENNNNLQGFEPTSINLGLMKDDSLLALMTFSKPRLSSEHDWELVRYTTKKGITVVGGPSKILKYFRSIHTGSIISYANNDFSYKGAESLYNVLGFTFKKETGPGYNWVHPHKREIIPVSHLHPEKLSKEHLDKYIDNNFNENENEDNFMYNNGYRRLWNAGNDVYELK